MAHTDPIWALQQTLDLAERRYSDVLKRLADHTNGCTCDSCTIIAQKDAEIERVREEERTTWQAAENAHRCREEAEARIAALLRVSVAATNVVESSLMTSTRPAEVPTSVLLNLRDALAALEQDSPRKGLL